MVLSLIFTNGPLCSRGTAERFKEGALDAHRRTRYAFYRSASIIANRCGGVKSPRETLRQAPAGAGGTTSARSQRNHRDAQRLQKERDTMLRRTMKHAWLVAVIAAVAVVASVAQGATGRSAKVIEITCTACQDSPTDPFLQ